MPSTFAETAPIEEVITKFKKIVPNPRENRSIVAESDVHRKICTKLAEALNKRYDMKVIDLDAEPAEICKKAGELLYSLFNGLHTEFLTIAADVTRTLSNLEVLKKYVDAANQRLVAELNKKGDAGEAKALENLYNLLATEIDRQHHILANLTDTVITPSSKSLVELLENSTDFATLNEDLKKSLGTPYFGEKLGLVLHGTSMIAEAARVVDKALQDVGMSIKQYKDVKSPAELKNEVYK